MSDDALTLATLQDLADRVVAQARALGAQEVRATVSRGVSTELSRRDGKIEKAEQSRSMALHVALLVDDRFSAHATSDLRPEALAPFLAQAVDATRFLEPDPDRRLPERDLMGSAPDALDPFDAGIATQDPAERRARLAELEDSLRAAAGPDRVRSVSTFVWDGLSQRAGATSHGFRSTWESTSFGHGATVSLEDEGGRLPEGWSSTGSRHKADLPPPGDVARAALERARHRLGSGPGKSGRYPALVDAQATGRLLGLLLGPMDGETLYEKRSCLEGRLGQRIGAPGLDLLDDPLIPRASGSRPHDGDGLPSQRRPLVLGGVLQTWLIDVYNGRRLGLLPTGGSTGNLLVPPGTASPARLVADRPRAIRVEGYLGGNANPTTGDFSFGISGQLLHHGVPVQNLSEMNVSGNLFELLDRFVAAADDVWTWSTWRTPSLLFDDLQFSGA